MQRIRGVGSLWGDKALEGKRLFVNNGLPLQCFVCSEPSDASATYCNSNWFMASPFQRARTEASRSRRTLRTSFCWRSCTSWTSFSSSTSLSDYERLSVRPMVSIGNVPRFEFVDNYYSDTTNNQVLCLFRAVCVKLMRTTCIGFIAEYPNKLVYKKRWPMHQIEKRERI